VKVAWGDDDEMGPFFCTFKCFERDADMLLENLECLSQASVEISFGDFRLIRAALQRRGSARGRLDRNRFQ
jgi:hypothetical protein